MTIKPPDQEVHHEHERIKSNNRVRIPQRLQNYIVYNGVRLQVNRSSIFLDSNLAIKFSAKKFIAHFLRSLLTAPTTRVLGFLWPPTADARPSILARRWSRTLWRLSSICFNLWASILEPRRKEEVAAFDPGLFLTDNVIGRGDPPGDALRLFPNVKTLGLAGLEEDDRFLGDLIPIGDWGKAETIVLGDETGGDEAVLGEDFAELRMFLLGDWLAEGDFFGEAEATSVLSDWMAEPGSFFSSILSRFLLELAGGDCHLFGWGDLVGDVSLGAGDWVPAWLLRLSRVISLGKPSSLLATLTKLVTTPLTKTSRKSPFGTPLLRRPCRRPFLFFIFCMDFVIKLQMVSLGRSTVL